MNINGLEHIICENKHSNHISYVNISHLEHMTGALGPRALIVPQRSRDVVRCVRSRLPFITKPNCRVRVEVRVRVRVRVRVVVGGGSEMRTR